MQWRLEPMIIADIPLHILSPMKFYARELEVMLRDDMISEYR